MGMKTATLGAQTAFIFDHLSVQETFTKHDIFRSVEDLLLSTSGILNHNE